LKKSPRAGFEAGFIAIVETDPTISVLAQIAKALKVGPDVLLRLE